LSPALSTLPNGLLVQTSDREIRKRLDRGAEDTFTNLLRFG